MLRLSRRTIAAYAADELLAGRKDALLPKLAAYLVEHRMTGGIELLVADVERQLARRGVLVADVASARPLGDELQQTITNMLTAASGVTTVLPRLRIDSGLLGGIVITSPVGTLDTSIRSKLRQLKTLAA